MSYSKISLLRNIFFGSVLTLSIALANNAVCAEPQSPIQQKSANNLESLLQELKIQRTTIKTNPDDAKAHFQLAELLRKCGRDKEAAQEYLAATEIDPTMYVAFHQLSQINADPNQLNEAIEKLKIQMEAKPKELMLRVALSELLEKQAEYYKAARVLIDMVYSGSVPPKYTARVNARVHFLLNQSKTSQNTNQAVSDEHDLNIVPAPLPETSTHNKAIHRGVSRETRKIKGLGNIPLLD